MESKRTEDRSVHFAGAYDVVGMAASAGGFLAIRQVLAMLPGDFPAAIAIVQHLDPNHPSLMATLLARATPLNVKQAEATDLLAPGTVFIAPPNYHLLVNPDGSLTLTQTELVHFVRPSADLLFESIAASFHERAIAVVLSGSGLDGETGVRAIKKMGGVVLVQDAESSEFPGMPNAAIQSGAVDEVLPLGEIAPRLVELMFGQNEQI